MKKIITKLIDLNPYFHILAIIVVNISWIGWLVLLNAVTGPYDKGLLRPLSQLVWWSTGFRLFMLVSHFFVIVLVPAFLAITGIKAASKRGYKYLKYIFILMIIFSLPYCFFIMVCDLMGHTY